MLLHLGRILTARQAGQMGWRLRSPSLNAAKDSLLHVYLDFKLAQFELDLQRQSKTTR